MKIEIMLEFIYQNFEKWSKNLKKLLLFIIFIAVTIAFAAGDSVVFDAKTKTLSYIIDYDRLVVNAKVQRCSPEAFKDGLLHSVLNNIFLFLPYEASFRDDVDFLEVRVLKTNENGSEELVLRAASSLEALTATNERFRVFMNAFNSTNASYCFAVSQETMKSWLNTLFARGGELVYSDEIFDIKLPELVNSNKNPETNIIGQEAQARQTANPDNNKAKESTIIEDEEYFIVPFISDKPVRKFDKAEDVLEPNQDYYAYVETSKGTMLVDLFEDKTPKTVNNFVFLAQNHFYDNLDFFNVIDGFIAQTGDPTGSGSGGAGYLFDDEIYTAYSHGGAGVMSMANTGPNTNSSQFLFTLGPAPRLDRQNSIFGAVVAGVEVLALLEKTDLAEPIAIASLNNSLGLLAIQEINLDGSEDLTLKEYIETKLGSLPKQEARANLDNYSFIISRNPQTDKLAVSFYNKPDSIKSITILQKAK